MDRAALPESSSLLPHAEQNAPRPDDASPHSTQNAAAITIADQLALERQATQCLSAAATSPLTRGSFLESTRGPPCSTTTPASSSSRMLSSHCRPSSGSSSIGAFCCGRERPWPSIRSAFKRQQVIVRRTSTGITQPAVGGSLIYLARRVFCDTPLSRLTGPDRRFGHVRWSGVRREQLGRLQLTTRPRQVFQHARSRPSPSSSTGASPATGDVWSDAFAVVAQIFGASYGLGLESIPCAEDGRIDIAAIERHAR